MAIPQGPLRLFAGFRPRPFGRRRAVTGATLVAVFALAVGCLAACSDPQSGTGSPADGRTNATGPSSSAATSAPARPATTPASKSTTPASTPTAPISVGSVTGSGSSATTYEMSLWAKDTVTDCGAHAYGQPILTYFRTHPCRSATRRLWTFDLNGRRVALSVVTVQAQVTKVNENPDFSAAQQLVDLEKADGTGSINDLMREGKRIPATSATIPSNEVFYVGGEDGTVVIMDGWYTSGATNPQDGPLGSAELDLSLSDAAAPE